MFERQKLTETVIICELTLKKKHKRTLNTNVLYIRARVCVIKSQEKNRQPAAKLTQTSRVLFVSVEQPQWKEPKE